MVFADARILLDATLANLRLIPIFAAVLVCASCTAPTAERHVDEDARTISKEELDNGCFVVERSDSGGGLAISPQVVCPAAR
jgi:hypothetical protein